ncbi:MAG: putative altronate dehydratase [Acidimicrobiaceae bacterium]|nr:putative altronate dehydratase [Acidimicrobiaceae bacterium]
MTSPAETLFGYHRDGGAVGARNHVLVLPSVVCSTRVARQIAGSAAVAVTHQHGCGQVGDDVALTSRLFIGVAAHPNVASVLVVGLGCETIGGDGLAEAIRAEGQRVEFVGIQECGGSAATVERGLHLLEALLDEAAVAERATAPLVALRVGLDDPRAPFAHELAERAEDVGMTLLLPDTPGPFGELCHAELASAGAQVIVASCGPGEGPRSFATCPVLSVSSDASLFAALGEDFDLGPDGDNAMDPELIADQLITAACSVFNGGATAAERRGAAEFTLRRLTRSM